MSPVIEHALLPPGNGDQLGRGRLHDVGELEPFVSAAAGGDTKAFAHLMEATSGLVNAIALAIVRDVDQSRDLAQDVFLSAWRNLARLRSPASFVPWLRQLTRNQAHSSVRTRVRRRRWILPMRDEHSADKVSDERPNASDGLLTAEQREIVREALADLPADTRETLTLFYLEGQSVAQTAALLQVSEDAIKKRLSRARHALRQGVLARLGEALGASAPGAAFGVAVIAALPIMTTTPASAMSASAAKVAVGSADWFWGAVGWVFKAILPVALLSALPTLASWLAARHFMRIARDARERRQMRWFWTANMITYIGTAIGFELRAKFFRHWGDLLVFGAFTLIMVALHFLWLPRIVRCRHEAEMREDPVKASVARRRERFGRMIGWGLGLGLMWVALVIKHAQYAG